MCESVRLFGRRAAVARWCLNSLIGTREGNIRDAHDRAGKVRASCSYSSYKGYILAEAKDVNWILLRKEYTETTASLKELGEKYGLHFTTIGQKARKEGWVRVAKQALAERPNVDLPSAEVLGYLCSENAKTIINRVLCGWSLKQAFRSVGIKEAESKKWLTQDPHFAELLMAARATALGLAEAALYDGAVRRGSTDAALKILANAPETKEGYSNQQDNKGVAITVQIGSVAWNRDKPPIEVEYEEIK